MATKKTTKKTSAPRKTSRRAATRKPKDDTPRLSNGTVDMSEVGEGVGFDVPRTDRWIGRGGKKVFHVVCCGVTLSTERNWTVPVKDDERAAVEEIRQIFQAAMENVKRQYKNILVEEADSYDVYQSDIDGNPYEGYRDMLDLHVEKQEK